MPTVGTFDLGYLFTSFPQQTKAFDAVPPKPIDEALLKGANIRIIGWLQFRRAQRSGQDSDVIELR